MYHTQILAFVFDTLKWTSSKKSRGHQKPYSHLRSAAYRALTLWCNTMKHGSRCEIIAEGIINEIIFDITPFENEFTLKVLSGGKKHMSKKARRQLHKAQNEQSNLAQQHSNPSDSQAKKELFSDEGNQKLCVAALQSFSSVFLSAGCFLKPTVVKSCHLKIVSISLAITDATPKNDHLYSNYLCRLELYNALQSFILSPHHLCPPPTQMTVKLLQTAQIKDTNVFVRDACSMILNNLEKVIHPQKESLVFPPDIRDIRNAFHKVGKEKLLAAQPNGQVMDEEDKSEEEDETSDEEESDNMEVEQNDEPKQAVKAPEAQKIAVNIDLTLDDCNTREAIHVESSNDSVEFVREETPQTSDSDLLKLKNKRINEQQKSPEITLRVEEEDEEEEIEGINQAENVIKEVEEPINQIINPHIEILSNGKINQLDYEPSSPKRPRLEEEVDPMNVTDNIERAASVDKDTENLNTENNETSFEDIAAAFVDELN